jgi:hypothetical protein
MLVVNHRVQKTRMIKDATTHTTDDAILLLAHHQGEQEEEVVVEVAAAEVEEDDHLQLPQVAPEAANIVHVAVFRISTNSRTSLEHSPLRSRKA